MLNQDKIKLICLGCGNIFRAEIRSNAKFCSNKCGYKYRRKTGISKRGNQIKMNCLVCGKEFYENKSNSKIKKYCSKKCADVGKVPRINNMNRNIVENTCKNCSKKFHKEFYKLAKFCNRNCLREYQSKKWREFVCKICKNKFKVRLCILKERKPKYCSRKCFMKRGHSTKMITKTCPICNNKFTLPHYKFKEYKLKDGTIKRGRRFCSDKCGKKGKWK